MSKAIIKCKPCSGSRSSRTLLVYTVDDLKDLRPWSPRRYDAVRIVGLPDLLEWDAELGPQIEVDYLECGCRAGRFAAGAVAVLALVILVCAHNDLRGLSFESWFLMVASICMVPLFAMLTAIVSARRRLTGRIRLIHQFYGFERFERRLRPIDQEAHGIICGGAADRRPFP